MAQAHQQLRDQLKAAQQYWEIRPLSTIVASRPFPTARFLQLQSDEHSENGFMIRGMPTAEYLEKQRQSESPDSKFLKLPPELRNHIYDFMLGDGGAQEYRFMYGQHAAVPSLLHLNRKIRGETLALYYRNQTFNLITHHRCLRPL